MSQPQLSEKETKIISSLQKYLNKTSRLYDVYKTNINDDISYFENAQRVIGNLIQGLNFKSDPQYTSHPMYKQPVGSAMQDLVKSFTEINNVITLDVLPALRQYVGQTQVNKVTLDKNIERNIDSLKKALLKYHERKTAINKTRDSKDMLDLVKSQCTTTGLESSQNFMDVIGEIGRIEELIMKELTTQEDCLAKLKSNEDKIMIAVSTRIQKSIPYLKEVFVKRQIEDINTVAYFRYFITEALLQLKCSFTSSHVPHRESAARKWLTEDKMEPFYARVWEDFEPKSENEIAVLKKERVKVTQAGFNNYWFIQKTNNTSGYVPVDILEPIE